MLLNKSNLMLVGLVEFFVLFLWLQAHIASSGPVFHPPVSLGPPLRGCSQSIHSSACSDIGDFSKQGAEPWTYSC